MWNPNKKEPSARLWTLNGRHSMSVNKATFQLSFLSKELSDTAVKELGERPEADFESDIKGSPFKQICG